MELLLSLPKKTIPIFLPASKDQPTEAVQRADGKIRPVNSRLWGSTKVAGVTRNGQRRTKPHRRTGAQGRSSNTNIKKSPTHQNR
jgi:hypothetical protein